MANVVCECGKTVKSESALAQHKRDSPRHRQNVEPAAPSNDTLSKGPVSHVTSRTILHQDDSSLLIIIILKQPSNTGTARFSSRYPPIQFVRAGESIKRNGKKGKGRIGTKLSRGTGPEVPQLRVNEYGKSYVSGLGDEDWSLCDKDCAWCGHCADGVDF